MIQFKNVSKIYQTRLGPRSIFNNLNLLIKKGEKIGILGKNGEGKSTLVRLIGGAESPTTGIIKRTMNVSWPITFGGGFQGSLTGFDNLRFICRVYGTDFKKAVPFVESFTELGMYLREPVKNYSSGMRAKLAFAISMSVEFDCYLIDESMAVGDSRFRKKCHEELFVKRKDRGLIMVSHQAESIKKYCSRVFVLKDKMIYEFPDVDTGYKFYNLKSRE